MSPTSAVQFDDEELCEKFAEEMPANTGSGRINTPGKWGRIGISAVAAAGLVTLAQHIFPRDAVSRVDRKLFVEVLDPAAALMDIDCGCPATCTTDVLDQQAGEYTCRERIVMEMAKSYGKYAEELSCKLVAAEFPDVCGGNCHPERCPKSTEEVSNSQTSLPTMSTESVLENLKPLSPEMEEKYQSLALLRNVTEPVRVSDVPFFFHIFKSAGSTMKTLMGDCYGLVRAHQTKETPSLEVMRGRPGGDLVNVHTHRPDSIKQAKEMGLIESGVSDVIVSSFMYEGADLFNQNQQGRMFSVFRHPVERAVSLFFYLCHATWEDTHDPSFCKETLHDYAVRVSEEKGIEQNNWVTRRLVGLMKGELTEDHLTLAIEVIRSKFLVGLIDEMDETMSRLESFFGWKTKDDNCINHFLHDKPENQYKHQHAEEGSAEYNLIASAYSYDMRLYQAVQEIFKEQSALFQ